MHLWRSPPSERRRSLGSGATTLEALEPAAALPHNAPGAIERLRGAREGRVGSGGAYLNAVGVTGASVVTQFCLPSDSNVRSPATPI